MRNSRLHFEVLLFANDSTIWRPVQKVGEDDKYLFTNVKTRDNAVQLRSWEAEEKTR